MHFYEEAVREVFAVGQQAQVDVILGMRYPLLQTVKALVKAERDF